MRHLNTYSSTGGTPARTSCLLTSSMALFFHASPIVFHVTCASRSCCLVASLAVMSCGVLTQTQTKTQTQNQNQ
jgi:hypothetical protein